MHFCNASTVCQDLGKARPPSTEPLNERDELATTTSHPRSASSSRASVEDAKNLPILRSNRVPRRRPSTAMLTLTTSFLIFLLVFNNVPVSIGESVDVGGSQTVDDGPAKLAPDLDDEIEKTKARLNRAVKSGKAKEEADKRIKTKCDVCRSIVLKFYEGFKRTKKSGYGGGNTAWEEKSLGRNSFAWSEARFVEVMEKVCDDVSGETEKFYCGDIVGEYEDQIEEWYQQKKVFDLEQLLCIEALSVCCPMNTFGRSCSACRETAPSVYCNGQGECDGNGTRVGSGDCNCRSPYKGRKCRDCEKDYFMDSRQSTDALVICKECHESCGNDGCDGPKPENCVNCDLGYVMNGTDGCQDIDECADKIFCPKANEYCINSVGSYECKKCNKICDQTRGCNGDGPDHCVACRAGAAWDAERKNCVVVDWTVYDKDVNKDNDEHDEDDEKENDTDDENDQHSKDEL